MKNIFLKITSCAVLLLLATGCEDFVDREPIIEQTIEESYQSEEDAINAVNGAYAALQFELSPAGHFRWFWGDIMSDDSEKGGSSLNDVFILHQLETFEGPTNSDLLQGEWDANYEGIYRANVVLEYVPAINMDETKKAQILGEAKFIRAWFHYMLVTMFGDVPKIDHVLAPSEYYATARSPKEEVWALIEQDLLDAIAALPMKSEWGAGNVGRASKGAAQSLLGKAYLFQGKFADAKGILGDVINSNEYSLTPSYSDIFIQSGENNMESVFEIQYMNASGGNWGKNNANEGTFTNVFQRPRGQFEGYGFNIPTQSLVDEFFAEGFEDPRLEFTVFREGDAMGDRGTFTKEATGTEYDFHPRKYFSNVSETAPFGDPNPNGGSNDRVIRYADVLLMYAEAAAQTSDESAAQSALNQVRQRVGLADVTASGSALIDAIYHERRVELALEGHRFFDLVRTGRAAAALGSLGFDANIHSVFPIPDAEIQLTNNVITQNPGY